jgi:cell division protein FtsQ
MSPRVLSVVRWTSGAAALAGLSAGLWYGYGSVMERPIERVEFTGETTHVARVDLEQLAAGVRGHPSSAAKLAEVREAARRIPWVRDAFVRRRFPAAVEVTIASFEPLARWDETRLVSTRGELFAAEFTGDLPKFTGPDSTEADMASTWAVVSPALAPLASPVVELRLSARRAWQVRLASGLVLELGRDDLEGRMQRFTDSWPQLAALDPKHVDLRYGNGFALRTAVIEAKPNPIATKKKT